MSSAFYKSVSQKSGQIEALEIFASASAKTKPDLMKEINEDQWNALHWATQYGNTKLITEMILSNADLNEVTREGYSAVYIAARANNSEILQQFIEAKADLDLQDGHKQTALHRACENQFEEIAVMLIKAGANINLQDMMGRTALHWTCSKNLLKVAELLLEHDALMLKTQGNETPLHWAASCDSLPMTQLLLKFHPELNVYEKNDRDETAVQMTTVQELRDLLIGTNITCSQAHAHSLGLEPETGGNKISNQSFGTSVKSVADNKPKAKKLTIKLKPK